MNKFRNIICLCVALVLVFSITGCNKKESSVYDKDPITATPAPTAEPTAEPTATPTPAPTATEGPSPTPTPKVITVQSIINDCKLFIRGKGCLEQTTDVNYECISTYNKQDTKTINKATLESGFNQDFYFIIEKSSSIMGGTETKNPGYVFCIDDKLGYISYNNKEFKILTDIVLDNCELPDLKVATLTDRFLQNLILDQDNCELSQDDEYYIIDQRLSFGDLSINKANSCSFLFFEKDTSIRQTLRFDKETFALVSSDVICNVLNVAQNKQESLTVHTDYKYTQSKTYDSETLTDEKIIEIDSFRGYSIY